MLSKISIQSLFFVLSNSKAKFNICSYYNNKSFKTFNQVKVNLIAMKIQNQTTNIKWKQITDYK